MPKSMTGFATGTQTLDGVQLICELRAVNSRYLDLHFKLDDALKYAEPLIREQLNATLSRGKVECKLSLSQPFGVSTEQALNVETLQFLHALQQQVLLQFPQSPPLGVADILNWPGIMVHQAANASALQNALAEVVTQTLQALQTAREREGDKLSHMILEKIALMEAQMQIVLPLLPRIQQTYKEKLHQKLRESLAQIEHERVAQEVVMYAQRIDVDEEISRLNAHISEVKCILKNSAPVGKRLDFLMQEMNREANTLGSKSAALEITQVSMELKVLIEQIREQVQNLE